VKLYAEITWFTVRCAAWGHLLLLCIWRPS